MNKGLVWNDKKIIAEVESDCDKKCKRIAHAIKRDAQAGCPVESGEARDSIEVVKSKYPDGGYMIIGGAHGSHKAWWFTLIELGSSKHSPVAMLRKSLKKNERPMKSEFGAK